MGFSLPFLKKKNSNNLYFGLYLTDASIFGFVFDTSMGTPQILTQNSVSLSSGFDKILEDTDNLISQLELQTNKHLDKTIFFLHSWMIDEQTFEIKEPYKTIVKNLSKDLELEPMGYIDVQDALHEHLKKTSTLNTTAIEVNKTKIGISVYKGGKKIYSQYTARTDTVGEDVQSVLESIPGQVVLPAKIMVFGDIDTPEVSSELATYEWNEKIFAQHPTIEVLKQTELNQSLALTFTDEAISQSKTPTPEEENSDTVIQQGSSLKQDPAQDFGFVVGHDVKEDSTVPETQVPLNTTPEPLINDNINGDMEDKASMLDKLKAFIPSFSFQSKSNQNNSIKPIVYGVIVALVLFLLLFLYEYFFHKMEVQVYLKSNNVEETFDIEVPISESETDELAVLKKTTVQEYEDQKKTSGKREVGEKATGEVVIHNYDKESRTFPRGTELRKGNLVFVIDTEVKVASSSGGTADGVKESGKAKVKATAEEIGSEYNIAKGTQLSVASLSDSLFTSFVESAFTGGVKKEVTTVSKADLDALEKNVQAKAEKGSQDVLGTQISTDDIIIPDLTSIEVAETTYSAEVGEEASDLSIKAESAIEFYTLKRPTLEKKLIELMQEKQSEEYRIDAQNISFEIQDVDAGDETVMLEVDTTGKSLKLVDLEKIKNESRFKTEASLMKLIKQKFEVEDVKINKSFGFSLWTPIFKKNIIVQTEADN